VNFNDHTEEVFDCTNSGILAINTNSLITICNKTAGRLLGLNPKDILGKAIQDVFGTEHFTLPKVIATGQPEFSLRIKYNGRDMLFSHTPLFTDNRITGAVAVFQDILEIEILSPELEHVRHLYNQLETFVGASFDGIIATDAQGIVLKINKAHTRLTGLDKANFIGKPIEELFNKRITKFESITAKALNEGRTVTGFQFFNPTKKELMVTATPVFNGDGSIAGAITNLRDISELNQLKEKLTESQLVSSIRKADISHVLKEKIQQDEIIVESNEMIKALTIAMKVAKTDSTILITGESGVGKEIVARVIHSVSDRAKGNFIQINCGAIPENLLEAELFGYEAGAFTGARRQGKVGLFELANNGSILLDEIAEMPINLQVKLLRVLQEQETYRLGGTTSIKLSARVIASTNKNLWDCVEQGTFREDLFYRINVIPINVPSLRQRKDDIIPLVTYFVNSFNVKYHVDRFLEPKALAILMDYEWPGNVRELKNVIERLVILCDGNTISDQQVSEQFNSNQKQTPKPVVVNGILPLKDAQEMMERDLLQMAINKYKTTRKAAQALGIAHSSVVRKLARHDMKALQLWPTYIDN